MHQSGLIAVCWILVSGFTLSTGCDVFSRKPFCNKPCEPKIIDTNPNSLLNGGEGVCLYPKLVEEEYCTRHCEDCRGICIGKRNETIYFFKCCKGRRQSGNACPLKIPCNSPPEIGNGKRSSSNTTYAVGENVTYSCNEHYHLEDGTNATCLEGPRWSSIPRCVPKPCFAPPIPEKAEISGGSKGTYPVGSSVRIVCKSGLEMVSGNAIRRCEIANRWSGTSPSCQ